MEFQLRDGDYVPDGRGGLRTLEGAEEVLQRVLFRLNARRGAMPFLPRMGSRLHLLLRAQPSARRAGAEQYVLQALEDETEVAVRSVSFTETEDGRGLLEVYLDWQGETLTAEVRL